jgi:hypothetical protein
MVRTCAALTGVAVMLTASMGGAGNQIAWNLHVGEVAVALPTTLFTGRPLPIKATHWQCFADKSLRQDTEGNTFSTLVIRCNDAETTFSAFASCSIGGHDTDRLSFELLEKTSNAKTAIRAECANGF